MAYKVRYYCTSNTGKVRSKNQDNFFCDNNFMQENNCGTEGILSGDISCNEPSVFAVFDGIGGCVRGETAAYIAASTLSEAELCGKPAEALTGFCLSANGKICDFAFENGIRSMGTTAAIILFGRKKIHLCNIGDSKILRISDGEIHQLSKDHVSFLSASGKGALSQYLGIPDSEFTIMPHTAKASYRSGTVYLICSDGLTDMVDSSEILRTVTENSGEAAAELLLAKALENGGVDNITFILLYVSE